MLYLTINLLALTSALTERGSQMKYYWEHRAECDNLVQGDPVRALTVREIAAETWARNSFSPRIKWWAEAYNDHCLSVLESVGMESNSH